MSAETRMEQGKQLLATPHAAAVAGILSGTLFTAAHLILRFSVANSPAETGASLMEKARVLSVISYFVPFAGIFFLWFIGVARDRLGQWEDRFFATIFLGSGLLYLAMIFSATAIGAGVMATSPSLGRQSIDSPYPSRTRLSTYMASVWRLFLCSPAGPCGTGRKQCALDVIPDVCPGTGASDAGVFHFLENTCLSSLDAGRQHPDIDHQ